MGSWLAFWGTQGCCGKRRCGENNTSADSRLRCWWVAGTKSVSPVSYVSGAGGWGTAVLTLPPLCSPLHQPDSSAHVSRMEREVSPGRLMQPPAPCKGQAVSWPPEGLSPPTPLLPSESSGKPQLPQRGSSAGQGAVAISVCFCSSEGLILRHLVVWVHRQRSPTPMWFGVFL